MLDHQDGRSFPTDDSLCEHCGYPLRGLPIDTDCPECGSALSLSSPILRQKTPVERYFGFDTFLRMYWRVLTTPRATFRVLKADEAKHAASAFMAVAIIVPVLAWAWLPVVIDLAVSGHAAWRGNHAARVLLMPVVVVLAMIALTYIEVLGVTAFSRRRGWRVPFRLAERVCCYASVGWLPGVLTAAIGLWLLQTHAAGRPWFEQLLGLVRVSWICYGAVFVLSLMWFETLVWIGVRQVKYANAWPPRAAQVDPTEENVTRPDPRKSDL